MTTNNTNAITQLQKDFKTLQMDVDNLKKWKNSQPMQDATMSHMRISGLIPDPASASGFKIGLDQSPLTPTGERIAELEEENAYLVLGWAVFTHKPLKAARDLMDASDDN